MNIPEEQKQEWKTPPQPIWTVNIEATDYPVLKDDVKVDVAVVGGGLVGITLAYLLKQEGLKVAVIESDHIGRGTTGHTTAKITSQHNLIYDKLLKHIGKEKTQLYVEANEGAAKFMEDTIKNKNIECHFSKQPAYVYTEIDKYVSKIQDEVKAALDLGIKAFYTEEIPLPIKIKAAECFENQSQFHPLKYLLALAEGIPSDGSYIFEGTRAVDFHEGNPSKVITDSGHTVTAESLVIASHFPAYGGSGYYFARMYPERAYAVAAKIKDNYPGGMYVTAETPGRSIRSCPLENDNFIIVAGEKHKTGQGPDTSTHYANLALFARETFPVIDIPFRWSTQDYTTLDDLPYVGRISSKSQNTYVATGFGKWGITNGTAAALLIKDLIVNGESPWSPVYDPSRFEADPMIKNFIMTNATVAKHLIGDKLKPVSNDNDMAPGEARVIRQDGQKIGIYKDENGELHSVEIVCTHMGCYLVWNAAELSWDCPCHGSRFTYRGDIIEGPALKTLKTSQSRFNP
ncbi:MAG TPA: FAD-dependent oxidoreductase [Firmicutes bacterium]|nr:FAD-dependent oxidoreductase [Bacillota bacterium]